MSRRGRNREGRGGGQELDWHLSVSIIIYNTVECCFRCSLFHLPYKLLNGGARKLITLFGKKKENFFVRCTSNTFVKYQLQNMKSSSGILADIRSEKTERFSIL